MSSQQPVPIYPGKPYPPGATWDGQGVNFVLFSEHATSVELCLFDSPEDQVESVRIALPGRKEFFWHGYVPGIQPGQCYAYRISGPWSPREGHRFNPAKLVVDPYAKVIGRLPQMNEILHAYRIGSRDADLRKDDRDSAPYAALGMVFEDAFDWEGDTRPEIPMRDTVIYEAHAKGLTMLHPDVPEELRGTYAGLAHESVIGYLKDLGITAIELLPVHIHLDEPFVTGRGLSNYWGYNTLNFFYPEPRYAKSKDPGGVVNEFKEMVKAYHRAGLEVLIDVVYNHTCEGNELGPTLSFRGIDNRIYYKLSPENPRHYLNYTGTGNTVNVYQPRVLELVMDSLRYWVNEMHVDGFRFDLAVTMGRGIKDYSPYGNFFTAVGQDPVLSRVKLIAEPWDIGEQGYQIGNFPIRWGEWNGKFRDLMRAFWKSDPHLTAEFTTRFSGSSDLFGLSGRGPLASVNFITAHDGFTLYDLVSYNEKHNEQNGEENRDGSDHNFSWNGGEEGPTSDPEILSLRYRRMRSLMASLLLSQGVPMILAGDERARTQHGNNNAYCQDNEIGWVDWEIDVADQNFLVFVKDLIRLRKENAIFTREHFFGGQLNHKDKKVVDVLWIREDGKVMEEEDWLEAEPVGIYLPAEGFLETGSKGETYQAKTVLILVNPTPGAQKFQFPLDVPEKKWSRVFDTSLQFMDEKPVVLDALKSYPLHSRSMVLFTPTSDDAKSESSSGERKKKGKK